MNNFTIKSPSFRDNEFFPKKFTCDGDNVSPMLEIKNVPGEAKSLTLIMDDPDAPTNTWVHWLVWNIAPKTRYINEDTLPDNAIEGTTSFGKACYRGPCPPKGHGTHRYFFKLYALKKELDLNKNASKEELLKKMKNHIIAETKLMGKYSRE